MSKSVTVPLKGASPPVITDVDKGEGPCADDEKAPVLHTSSVEHNAGTAKRVAPRGDEVLKEGIAAKQKGTEKVAPASPLPGLSPGGASMGGSVSTHLTTGSRHTVGTDSTTTDKSEVQSMVASMSQFVSLLAQSMLQAQEIQAHQTKLLLGAI